MHTHPHPRVPFDVVWGYGRCTRNRGERMTDFRPKHLSVSSVALYATCPFQFKLRYVDRLVTPTTVPQAWGTAFHKALETLHRGGNAERAWIDAYNAMDDALAASGQQLTPSKVVGLDLLDLYRERGLDAVAGEPERKFMLPFPTAKIPVPLLGFIDLAAPSEREYRDWKTTSGSSWNAIKVALEPQVAVYGWAYQRLYHHRAEAAKWCIFHTANVTLDVYEVVPSPEQFRVFEQQAELVWEGIVAGNYEPCGKCSTCKPPTPRPTKSPSVTWEE